MYDDDQDVDELDRLLVCPYDANHRVAATRMNHHLVKCRKNYFVNESEKTICPFNAEHVIFSPEIDSHKILCPDKPEMMAEDVQTSDEKRAEDESEDVTVGEARETKPQTNGESDLPTDEESDETGCIKGLKVGGLKEYNIDSNNGDPKSTIIAVEHGGSCENDEKKPTQENGANGEFEDRLVNAVSHMAGIEPQDDNIAIEKQLSQSNGNIPSSENGVLTENTINGCPQEHFDYKKYAPSKEEREEFLQLIKQSKDEENLEDIDESLNQTFTTQPWQQNYSYLHQPYQTNQPYNPYTTTYITFPNGYQQVIGNMNGQSPYPTHFTFQQANGPPPQYMPQPVQGVNYDYNPGYAPRPKYRPQYRRRNYHQQNHSHNRHIHNGYHNHYNGYNHNNHGTRNHNNGYYANSHDAYSHTDTDSNSSASGQSDIGVTEHGVLNCNGHHLDNHRVRNPRRTTHTPSAKGSANLEKVVCIITDSDGESGPSSVNGHMSDPSPDPSESCESLGKKGEKDKVVRKLRKKLSEINALDNKKNSGVKMDCDQLKKLTRKKELEDELAALTID